MYCSNACKQQAFRDRSQNDVTPGQTSIMGVVPSRVTKPRLSRAEARKRHEAALPIKYSRTVTDAFYIELMFELGELVHRGGTAVGAAVVAKRVARQHGVRAAEWVSLPRLTRAELEDARWTDQQARSITS